MARKSRIASVYPMRRVWAQRMTLLFLLCLSLGFLGMDRAGNSAALSVRTQIMDTVTPVLSVIARPMDAVYNAGGWMIDMLHLQEENIQLKNQTIELLKWQSAAKTMEAENQSLRQLLHVVHDSKQSYVTARVVSDMAGPFARSALVAGGARDGIRKDQAAIHSDGLIGRVVDVGENSARLLLLTDINSRIPVIAERTREKAILAGHNSALPTLAYLAADSTIDIGDRIVTSGDGGIFPKGIPVGMVTAIEKGVVQVQLFADPAAVEYVSIVDYSL